MRGDGIFLLMANEGPCLSRSIEIKSQRHWQKVCRRYDTGRRYAGKICHGVAERVHKTVKALLQYMEALLLYGHFMATFIPNAQACIHGYIGVVMWDQGWG